MMRVSSVFTGTLCCLLLCAFGSCRPFFEREIFGAVLSLEGPAQSKRGEDSALLTTASRIQTGEIITTAEGTRADLMLLPGILIELAGATELEIRQLRLARDGDESINPMTAREARIRLHRGTLIALVGQSPTRSRLWIETEAGTLIAGTGRTLLVEVSGDNTRVMSVRGRVTFDPADGSSTKIDPGFFAQWPESEKPRAAAWAGAEAQAEVVQILKVERQLLHFGETERSAFLPWRE